jgi:hypothetical protein
VPTQKKPLPSQMRMEFFSEDDRSPAVSLHTIQNPPELFPHYSARLDNWNDFYIGFELEFSFDNKHWKKITHVFRR